MGKFDGKVAFVTGGARGQGRSHAVNLAKEGADVAILDLCAQVDSVAYPMATPEDLAETARLVEKEGRRALPIQADLRDYDAVVAAVQTTVRELGRLDYVVANAGILPVIGAKAQDMSAWHDVIDICLTGVYYTIKAAAEPMIEAGRGGSIVIIGSTSSLRGLSYSLEMANPGQIGYTAAKHAVLGVMREFGLVLGEYGIRVNTVAPMGVSSPMILNDEYAGQHDHAPAGWMGKTLDVQLVEPQDISEAVVWLLSDAARYVTGTTLPVDGGKQLK